MDEMISIIIPVYNIEPYIKTCIDSILNQTYKNLEILLVDDGSSDNCGEICDQYAVNDSRIRVLHKENGGLSDARNYGLKEAQGEIISFIDGDDYIDKQFYEIMLSQMRKNNSDIIECGCVKFCDGSTPEAVYESETKIMKPYDWLTESNLGEFVSCVVWNKLYKRSVLEGILFPVGRHYEDEATTYKAVYKANSITRINSALYFYRQREGSITQNERNIKEINEQFQSLEEKCIFFEKCNEKHIANFSYAKLGLFMISVYESRKKLTGKSKDWYSYLKNIFGRILKDSAVPVKYKVYIMMFILFPAIVGK